MSVLGPGATCCRNAGGDCEVECDFDKTAAPEAETPEALQVELPDETPRVDETEHAHSDEAPEDWK